MNDLRTEFDCLRTQSDKCYEDTAIKDLHFISKIDRRHIDHVTSSLQDNSIPVKVVSEISITHMEEGSIIGVKVR